MGANGGRDCCVAVEAESRFFGDALTLLLGDEDFDTASPAGGATAVDVVLVQAEGEPQESLGAVVAATRARYPGAQILFLVRAAAGSWDSAVAALGVAGWLSCEASRTRIAAAVAEVHRDGALRPQANDRTHQREECDELTGLLAHVTTREGEVLRRLVEGRSTDHIADELCISPQTVRAHVQNLMAKLGAHSRVQVVRLARQAGMKPTLQGADL